MYSNTIYILNNTIIECFDIAFNKTRKTLFFPPSFCGIPDAKKTPKTDKNTGYMMLINTRLHYRKRMRGNFNQWSLPMTPSE